MTEQQRILRRDKMKTSPHYKAIIDKIDDNYLNDPLKCRGKTVLRILNSVCCYISFTDKTWIHYSVFGNVAGSRWMTHHNEFADDLDYEQMRYLRLITKAQFKMLEVDFELGPET